METQASTPAADARFVPTDASALAEKMAVMRSERRRTTATASEFPTIAPPRIADTVVPQHAVPAAPRKLPRAELDAVMQTVGEFALAGASQDEIDLALEAEGVHPHDAHVMAPKIAAAVAAYRKKRKYAVRNGSALVVLGCIGMVAAMIMHSRAGLPLATPTRLYWYAAIHIAAGGIILPLRRVETYWAKIKPISRGHAAGEVRLAGQR